MTSEKFDFDTQMLDVFTRNLETLVEAFEKRKISANSFSGAVRDLINVTKRVPRSIIIEVKEEENG